jgi:hypothetical protein
MATVSRSDAGGGCYLYTWTLTTADHTGDALTIPGAPDKSVQFAGTWGGATAILEGSNNGTVHVGLADPQGNAISKTSDTGALEAVLENTVTIRPRLSAVGVGATVVASLLCRSGK